jgi:uncharacterized membrane protein YfcA
MPIILHPKVRKEQQESRSSPIENVLVRFCIGVMVGVVGFFIGFCWIGRISRAASWWSGAHPFTLSQCAIAGAVIGFIVGFALGDKLPEDWFSNLFGSRY